MAKAKAKKAKAKRSKPVKKAVKKAVKKVLRAARKVFKKPVPKPKAAKPKVAKPKVAKPAAPAPAALPGERIGVVTHYYGHLAVAVVKLDPGIVLRVGDNIHVKGHTSDFGQRVESLQVGHAPVQEVGPNDDFGLKVARHAREHDIVYRIRPS